MEYYKLRLAILTVLFSVIATFTIFMNLHYLGFTGYITGVANVTVYTTAQISLIKSNVYLGNLTLGESNRTQNTTQGDGFQIQNDGNTLINITVSATNLFSTATNPTGNYLYLISDAGNGTQNASVWKAPGTTLTWANVPATTTVAIEGLNDTDGFDIAEIDINVTIPSGESAGLKESTITFTGSSWS